jgi:hypothetical protein
LNASDVLPPWEKHVCSPCVLTLVLYSSM